MRRALGITLAALVFATPASAATKVTRYDAWTAAGEPTAPRYYHGSAECLQASRISNRDDAWRCISGNIALDPCFLSPTDDEVFCVTAPWARRGHLLSAVIDTASHGRSNGVDAWALRVGRRRCTYIANRRPRGASYRCGKGRYLFGRANRRRANWTIRIGKNRRSARRARIRQAWM
jgi:hypothetical protein